VTPPRVEPVRSPLVSRAPCVSNDNGPKNPATGTGRRHRRPSRASPERARAPLTVPRSPTTIMVSRTRAAFVRAVEESDVEEDSQSPRDRQAAVTLRSRRLRLAWRGEGRVRRWH
jgi:hypothetical protein